MQERTSIWKQERLFKAERKGRNVYGRNTSDEEEPGGKVERRRKGRGPGRAALREPLPEREATLAAETVPGDFLVFAYANGSYMIGDFGIRMRSRDRKYGEAFFYPGF